MTFQSKPELLREKTLQAVQDITVVPGIVAVPYNWQLPAATEKAAYDAVCAHGGLKDCVYLGVPWATVIDGLRHDATSTWDILRALNQIIRLPGFKDATRPRRVSVAQHIHAGRFLEFFQAAGVTDLFWTHATVDAPEMGVSASTPFRCSRCRRLRTPQTLIYIVRVAGSVISLGLLIPKFILRMCVSIFSRMQVNQKIC